jgi:hypothetical protein
MSWLDKLIEEGRARYGAGASGPPRGSTIDETLAYYTGPHVPEALNNLRQAFLPDVSGLAPLAISAGQKLSEGKIAEGLSETAQIPLTAAVEAAPGPNPMHVFAPALAGGGAAAIQLAGRYIASPVAREGGAIAKLSERAPHDFIISPRGGVDWASIGREIEDATKGAVKAGPIRVVRGTKDYGYEHLTPERMKRMQALGFETPSAFFDHVASNYNLILGQPTGRPALVVSPGQGFKSNRQVHNFMAVELEPFAGYYSPTTIVPDATEQYLRSGGKFELWRK